MGETTLMVTLHTQTAAMIADRDGETERIIAHVAEQIGAGLTSNPVLMDSQGYRVGSWTLDRARPRGDAYTLGRERMAELMEEERRIKREKTKETDR